MKAHIEFDMNNAAFEEFGEHEVVNICLEASDRITAVLVRHADTGDRIPLRDRNGNRIGFVEVAP